METSNAHDVVVDDADDMMTTVMMMMKSTEEIDFLLRVVFFISGD